MIEYRWQIYFGSSSSPRVGRSPKVRGRDCGRQRGSVQRYQPRTNRRPYRAMIGSALFFFSSLSEPNYARCYEISITRACCYCLRPNTPYGSLQWKVVENIRASVACHAMEYYYQWPRRGPGPPVQTTGRSSRVSCRGVRGGVAWRGVAWRGSSSSSTYSSRTPHHAHCKKYCSTIVNKNVVRII